MKKKKNSFEDDLKELEDIVSSLEQDSLDLKELMEKYTQGMELSRRCNMALTEAENVMDELIEENNGSVKAVPLKIEEYAEC